MIKLFREGRFARARKQRKVELGLTSEDKKRRQLDALATLIEQENAKKPVQASNRLQ